ncbi:MAG: AMP-binding protein [Flavobacteriales bacterium]|nr:AMP-binding protein [Flavobacteriales bacterium]
MHDSSIIVVDETHQRLPVGEKGELCLAGPQLTPGYWNDPERTSQVMFVAEHNGAPTRFYRTGDLCSIDADGDILYAGRLDQQTKIQGYRVELGERSSTTPAIHRRTMWWPLE